MADERDVLIYSKRFEGGVRLVSRMLSEMGRRPILVSDEPEDVNRDHCAAHVVVDWETASLEELVTAVEAAGVVPTAVVNFVESLISWQVRTARHYGLEGGENGREVLLSKARVRAAMTDRGLSSLPFVAGTVSSLDVDAVTSYPVIVKPDQDSGGSRLVRRAKDAVELRSRLKELADSVGPDTDAIVEQYIDGVEFSVDGPVLDGRFHPLFEVEKTEHDNLRHHDAGLLISPPPSAHVRQAVRELSERVGALYASLGLGSSWLHVEGRVRADGTCELVEINPRPGGRMYRAATQRVCGVDPIDMSVRMALGERLDGALAGATPGGTELLAMLPFEADRVGTLASATSVEELKRIPGVVDGYLFENFRVVTMDRENFFAEAMITADSVADLHEIAEQVRSVFTFTFE
ncbi:acetyl-CoA carboxylase biotin carboxylase subunit family protein [Streptomyces atratus]|uniref:ATP-grasp domain-containing protein n=1 Tax=Streptomyces atratus TaxID=1893 RepID=UPI0021A576E4|nr:ATP-grasp domain-containing protein [Streptomyces atratus]MCT2545003.1 ATP-grasp domain-containing protein [Streptomyces atratus]